MSKNSSPIEFTTACYDGGRLISFYTHGSRREADDVMRTYQSRPGWHLYTSIIQRDRNNAEFRVWAR